MDELEILKRDWKKKENSFNQVSEKEIYGMLHKRSSSIVKWILIISILEFLFLRILDISTFFDEDYSNQMKLNHIYEFEKYVTLLNFFVLSIFIYYFYKNFKSINNSSSVKKLMTDIINTRKTVKYYVWYNLILVGISSMFIIFSMFNYNKQINSFYLENKLFFIFIGLTIVVFIIVIIWLFYKLIYGILLKRLLNNYKELEKMDFN